jgi:S-DNA-T family DNA segregation ATPase FtsK/SpoIIIE
MSRQALLIATGKYLDPKLRDLRSPEQDVSALKPLLEDPEIGFFDQVTVLRDDESSRIRREIEQLFGNAGPDDLVLLYFSCHGIRPQSGKLFFAARDTIVDLPHSTGISASFVADVIADSQARAKLVLLDCCYSGAFTHGFVPRAGSYPDVDLERQIHGRGTYVITASLAVEYAYEGNELVLSDQRTSAFTETLVAGLRSGNADFDGDGDVGADDIYRYIRQEIALRPAGQTPTAYSDIQEPIIVAKARRDRTGLDGIWPVDSLTSTPRESPTLGELLRPISPVPGGGLYAEHWSGNGSLMVPVARSVERNGRLGDALCVNLSGRSGHVLVLGGVQTGKTTLLKTLILGLALTHSPNEAQFYCVDAGGYGLGKIAQLPHVVRSTSADQTSEVNAMLDEIEYRFVERRALLHELEVDDMATYRDIRSGLGTGGSRHADVFLVIDNWDELLAASERVAAVAQRVATQGLARGFHLVVSSRQWDELPPKLLAMLHTRLELRLDDPERSLIDAKHAGLLPHAAPGWGLAVGGRQFVVALPRAEDTSAEDQAASNLIQGVIANYADSDDTSATPSTRLTPSDFAGLLGIEDLERFDPLRAWQVSDPRSRLRVPLGLGEDGSPVMIDLKEAALGGMGPHGLCIGATGSGKSELLRTLVLALAVTHPPDAVNFVLVDFKGGATFTGMADLPHVSALITNLSSDLALVDRMSDALVGEMTRRQELLRAGQYKNIHDYQQARAAGVSLDPMPNLVIVVDEVAEMLTTKPELIDVFVQIGRIGRSLGLHLLLASQRLEEGRLRGFDAFLSYRLCLKTFSQAESRTALGVPDAYFLPSVPGSAYLKHNEELVRFRASYVSAPVEASRDVAGEPTDTTLDVICERLEGQGSPAHQVWLPPLSEPPTLDQLLPGLAVTPDRGLSATGFGGVGRLVVPIAVVDKPMHQRRDALYVDLSNFAGHAVIVGGPRSGKSTIIRTLISSLALTHTPVEAQFFCLDFGGGALAALSGLPHVGGVAGRLDVDRVRRIVAEVMGILNDREESFREHAIDSIGTFRARRARGELPDERFGDVFLVVDGWLTLRQDFELLEQDIFDIAQRGLGFGVHLVLTAARWAELRLALKDTINTRVELRLGDPAESDIDRKIAANVPVGAPGRGISQERLHFLGALPRLDGVSESADLVEGVEAMVKAIGSAWQGSPAPQVRMLPLVMPYDALPTPAEAPGLAVPIGVDETTLEPVYLDFEADSHLLVFGESESGKTSFLRMLCRAIIERYTPQQARLLVADYRRGLLGEIPDSHMLGYAAAGPAFAATVRDLKGALDHRLPPPDVTAEQLRDHSWWKGPDVFVIVDDYELITTSASPLAQLLELLPLAKDVGLHLIIARSSGGAGRALFEPIIQRLRELRTPGLLLSGDREEGALIGNARLSPQPPGRGTLVSRRHDKALIQTAWLPAHDPTEAPAEASPEAPAKTSAKASAEAPAGS